MNKKLMSLTFLFMMGILFLSSGVLAFKVNDTISTTSPVYPFTDFFNLGTTWALVIGAICIIAMIYVAAYDILGFTAFDKWWVKAIISGGIALITAVTSLPLGITTWLFGIMGIGITGTILVVIGIAVVFFIIASFFTGWAKTWKAGQKAQIIKANSKVGDALGQAGWKSILSVGKQTAKAGRTADRDPTDIM